mmetsp:Transcript_37700/g.98748  ORF Transcript_37700/g.98748 Transcript_37700/m.98748 type:complete len:202 (-) Transcript_37700:1593-2198(-)
MIGCFRQKCSNTMLSEWAICTMACLTLVNRISTGGCPCENHLNPFCCALKVPKIRPLPTTGLMSRFVIWIWGPRRGCSGAEGVNPPGVLQWSLYFFWHSLIDFMMSCKCLLSRDLKLISFANITDGSSNGGNIFSCAGVSGVTKLTRMTAPSASSVVATFLITATWKGTCHPCIGINNEKLSLSKATRFLRTPAGKASGSL